MVNIHPTSNVQKAVDFFNRVKLSRLLVRLRDKYIEVGRVGGQILLIDSTHNERQYLASFLGKPPYRDTTIKVTLVDFDHALRRSGFACTLPELLTAFFPNQPLVTRQAQKVLQESHQADFHTRLFSIASDLPEGSQGRRWLLQGSHGQTWLFSRNKNAQVAQQERLITLVRYIASILDQLPSPDAPERLALFAQRTSGDPHMLDPDRAAGRLFLLALSDLAAKQEQRLSEDPVTPQNRTQRLELYNFAGLLVDTISSSVAVFNLTDAMYHNGQHDPLVQVAGKRLLLLPLHQLLEWKSVVPASTDLYVFENPQVFEEVIVSLAPHTMPPTLICTSGWPSIAALTLLDRLLEVSPHHHLHYSGDFDLKGLQIATYMLARYPQRCSPWHFDPESYKHSMQSDGILAHANELAMLNTLPHIFTPLITTIQEHGKWAYQEGIADLLIRDCQ